MTDKQPSSSLKHPIYHTEGLWLILEMGETGIADRSIKGIICKPRVSYIRADILDIAFEALCPSPFYSFPRERQTGQRGSAKNCPGICMLMAGIGT